jgi:UDP-N-acetylmuramyl tripeptide synthase
MPSQDLTSDPVLAHDDSRRLPGPNRWFATRAVVLTALTDAAHDDAALSAWAARVRTLCAALHWPDPQPLAQRRQLGATLAFAAPTQALFTATEINEWAWERSADERGALAAFGAVPTQPATDDIAVLAPLFAARAAAERSPPLARLQAAALAHTLPLFDDDDSVSVGAGTGSRIWPRAALPLPMDVPWSQLQDIPTLLITGSNGKTTTTRLLAAIAQAAGHSPGLCSTEGVWVAGTLALPGDYAGPAGARAVLRHAGVDFAVLETARGGLLRRGLAVRRADAAVVTNISADHLGEYGVDSVDDIAETKLIVAHAVANSGSLVLNGGDALLMAVAARTPTVQAVRAQHRLALFALDSDHPALQALRAAGGNTCGLRGDKLTAYLHGVDHDLGDIRDMPLTLNGAASFHVENIAAAVLAAHAAGLPLAAIMATLQTFGSHPQDNAGRLERWLWHGATVLIDYAHNPDGLAQLLSVARALLPTEQPARLGLLLGQAGNRDDAAIADLAHTAAAAAPDHVLIKELPAMLRGRPPGQVPALLDAALRQAGLAADHIAHEADETAAALALLDWAQTGDVLVLPIHTTAVRARLAAVLSQAVSAQAAST